MSVNMEEAVLERNIRRFVLVRTAEPVYLELREGLVLIRHQSKYGSNLLAAFWCRVFQHPNNYPAFRFPYRKLYDTKGLWKIHLRLDNVLITIFTKTGTLSIKGNYVLEWFMDRFQGIMDAVDAPIQHPQPIRDTGEKRNMADNRRGDQRPVDEHQYHIRDNPRNIRSASREVTNVTGTNCRRIDKMDQPEVNNDNEKYDLPEAGSKLVQTPGERNKPLFASEERNKSVFASEERNKFVRVLEERDRLMISRSKPIIQACVDPGLDLIETTDKYHDACTTFENGINENNNERPCASLDDFLVNVVKSSQPVVHRLGGIDSGDNEVTVSQDNVVPDKSKLGDGHAIILRNGVAEEQPNVNNGDTTQDLEDIFGVNLNINEFDTKTVEDVGIETGVTRDNDDTPQEEKQSTECQVTCDTDAGGENDSPNVAQGVSGRNHYDILIDENQMEDFGQSLNKDEDGYRGGDLQDAGNNAFDLIDECHGLPTIVNNNTCHTEAVFVNDLIDVEPPPFIQNQHHSCLVDLPEPKKMPISIPEINANEEPRYRNRNGKGDKSMELRVTEDCKLSNECNGVDSCSVRQQLAELNQQLRLQQLDLWYGTSLETELEPLTVPSVKHGCYVYMLWKSLLQKLMATQNCKLYMASPYLDKPRLQDVCLAFLRNRLTACVDGVYVKRQTESGQFISDVKWSAIREFPANEQAVLEYKLYSSFVYPFVEFHYRFLAGVTDGQAEVLITSADFHGNHFETDNLDMVTYIKMSEVEFCNRFLNPLMNSYL